MFPFVFPRLCSRDSHTLAERWFQVLRARKERGEKERPNSWVYLLTCMDQCGHWASFCSLHFGTLPCLADCSWLACAAWRISCAGLKTSSVIASLLSSRKLSPLLLLPPPPRWSTGGRKRTCSRKALSTPALLTAAVHCSSRTAWVD